jgi:LysM domain
VDRAGSRRIDWQARPRAERQWRPGRVAGIAAGLLLVERLLVGEVGSPTMLIETLRDLGEPWADPVASVIALMGLVAEALVGYLLLLLVLRSLGALPGTMGLLARRVTVAMTPVVVRRLVEALVGSTLLVQVTLAAPGAPFDHRSSRSAEAVAASSALSPSGRLATAGDLLPPVDLRTAPLRPSTSSREPVRARPISRRSAVPLPPWLRDGPSKPAPGRAIDAGEYTIQVGDTLWDIAAAHLMPAGRSAATIHRYWQQVYRANRSVLDADPNLIYPGTRLDVVPFRQDRQ